MFQFTCPSRSTTKHIEDNTKLITVSIHVPLAEHDISDCNAGTARFVSIHVPLAEHDCIGVVKARDY